MSAPVPIVKPGIAGLASYDSQGRWITWSFTEILKTEELTEFFLSLDWRWIPQAGMWFDKEGNPAVAYFDGHKVEYPMERWP